MEPTPITLTFNRAAALHGHGMPEARRARMAARRAFVEMKQCFMRAAAEVDGDEGRTLQFKVRQAIEVTELWRLRGALFKALPRHTAPGELQREALRRHLHSAVKDVRNDTAVMPL